MEKTYKQNIDMWALDTDQAHILHRIGSDDYPEIRHTHVKPSELDQWEELAVEDIPPYTRAEYKAKIVELIRRRYDQDDECGILRQRDTKPDEFAAYNAYVEQCKADAPAAIAREKAEREAEEADENADTNA